MFRLQGRIQHYAWGSHHALPDFVGLPADGLPWAEIWYGSHPSAPAVVTSTTPWFPVPSQAQNEVADPAASHTLNEIIAADPTAVLGPDAAPTSVLPYLVKLLAAGRPLSLQAHPDADQAAAGYAHERQVGTSPTECNYADGRHKPETLFALLPTRALAGFRTPAAILADLRRLDVVGLGKAIEAMAQSDNDEEALRSGFDTVLRLEQSAVDEALAAIAARMVQPAEEHLWGSDSLAVAAELLVHYPGDVGVLAAIFLNALELEPGEALSVGAGVVHCYVSGLGLEVMANSDNVLRAGLTKKRVDFDELVRILDFKPGGALVSGPERQRIPGTPSTVRNYKTPAAEYAVKIYEINGGTYPVEVTDTAGPRIVVGLDGATVVSSQQSRMALTAGDAVLGIDGEALRLTGQGSVAIVRVP
ncbi:mannose-6-phosphate isomerase, type 1 [Micrococcales bacterium KH10]|nr:mannose-6-phosphate isomerase, type 1 [Micrococcales bacterium KH10]